MIAGRIGLRRLLPPATQRASNSFRSGICSACIDTTSAADPSDGLLRHVKSQKGNRILLPCSSAFEPREFAGHGWSPLERAVRESHSLKAIRDDAKLFRTSFSSFEPSYLATTDELTGNRPARSDGQADAANQSLSTVGLARTERVWNAGANLRR